MKIQIFLIALFFTGISALPQSRTITGTVSDGTDGLPGVTILIKGTQVGTETDFDGNYSIKAKEGDVLIYRFLGFKTVEKTVGKENKIDVTMQEQDNVLDEIVVVGFGSQSKRKLTDNVVKLNAADITNVPNPSVINNIAGKAAGVQVSQGNGKVEAGLNVRVRGQASIVRVLNLCTCWMVFL